MIFTDNIQDYAEGRQFSVYAGGKLFCTRLTEEEAQNIVNTETAFSLSSVEYAVVKELLNRVVFELQVEDAEDSLEVIYARTTHEAWSKLIGNYGAHLVKAAIIEMDR